MTILNNNPFRNKIKQEFNLYTNSYTQEFDIESCIKALKSLPSNCDTKEIRRVIDEYIVLNNLKDIIDINKYLNTLAEKIKHDMDVLITESVNEYSYVMDLWKKYKILKIDDKAERAAMEYALTKAMFEHKLIYGEGDNMLDSYTMMKNILKDIEDRVKYDTDETVEEYLRNKLIAIDNKEFTNISDEDKLDILNNIYLKEIDESKLNNISYKILDKALDTMLEIKIFRTKFSIERSALNLTEIAEIIGYLISIEDYSKDMGETEIYSRGFDILQEVLDEEAKKDGFPRLIVKYDALKLTAVPELITALIKKQYITPKLVIEDTLDIIKNNYNEIFNKQGGDNTMGTTSYNGSNLAKQYNKEIVDVEVLPKDLSVESLRNMSLKDIDRYGTQVQDMINISSSEILKKKQMQELGKSKKSLDALQDISKKNKRTLPLLNTPLKKLRHVQNNFAKINSQLDDIKDSLVQRHDDIDEYIDAMQQQVVNIDKATEQLRLYEDTLNEYALELQNNENSENDSLRIESVTSRLRNLAGTRVNAEQAQMEALLIMKSHQEGKHQLAEVIQNVIPVLSMQVVNSLGIQANKDTLNIISQTRNIIGNIVEQNAQDVKDMAIELQNNRTKSIVDNDKLMKAQQILNETIELVSKASVVEAETNLKLTNELRESAKDNMQIIENLKDLT